MVSSQGSTLPSAEALRAAIEDAGTRKAPRDLAREFGVAPEDRRAFRAMLRDLEREGVIESAGGRRVRAPGALPERCPVEVVGIDRDGEAFAHPVGWDGKGPPPIIYMQAEARGQPALAPGARVIARLRRIGGGRYEGRTLHRLDRIAATVVGVFHADKGADAQDAETKGGESGRIEPVERRSKASWRVPPGETGGAQEGEIVRAEPLPAQPHAMKPVRVIERIGQMGAPRTISLIAVASLGIPMDFPAEALAEAERAKAVRPGRRADLRAVPLVTIDGADARDFDDAVFAEPDGDGFRIIVAIADVAHYVRPGSALDRAARERGNSVYFPDRVVPMLPEALSNHWCSLKPGEPRGCMFAELRIGPDGGKRGHRFGRGILKSAARLTYEQVQDAHDRGLEEDLPAGTIGNLYAAYEALAAARAARGTLDLDLPERKIVLDDAGRITSIAPRPRLASHRLIEEFMILANVAAAEELERLHQPCMYRIHPPPSPEKIDTLRSLLSGFGIALKPAGQLKAADLGRVLEQVAGTDAAPLINEQVLRSQSQAEYAPENVGHFGLALRAYAHFTSPIRRYADLLVHRALISGLGLGAARNSDGLDPETAAGFVDLGVHLTMTERRAADAERQSSDRYLAAYLADRVGERFDARISGVSRFGLFVSLIETGASGFIPRPLLPDDYWHHDEASATLSGKRTRMVFRLADRLAVRLEEAKPVTGGLVFSLAEAAGAGAGDAAAPRHKARGKPKNEAKSKAKSKPNRGTSKPAGPARGRRRRASG